jgi:TonB family protein
MLLIFTADLSTIKPATNTDYTPPVVIKYTKPPELPELIKEKEINTKPLDPIKNKVTPEKIMYETIMPNTFTDTDGHGTIKIPVLEPGKHIAEPTKIKDIFVPGQVDRPPRILRPVTPVYPFDAKTKGIEGRVVLRFIIDEEGRVQNPQIVKADPEGVFDESALAAIVKYKFEPAVIGSRKVKCYVVLPVGFRLD